MTYLIRILSIVFWTVFISNLQVTLSKKSLEAIELEAACLKDLLKHFLRRIKPIAQNQSKDKIAIHHFHISPNQLMMADLFLNQNGIICLDLLGELEDTNLKSTRETTFIENENFFSWKNVLFSISFLVFLLILYLLRIKWKSFQNISLKFTFIYLFCLLLGISFVISCFKDYHEEVVKMQSEKLKPVPVYCYDASYKLSYLDSAGSVIKGFFGYEDECKRWLRNEIHPIFKINPLRIAMRTISQGVFEPISQFFLMLKDVINETFKTSYLFASLITYFLILILIPTSIIAIILAYYFTKKLSRPRLVEAGDGEAPLFIKQNANETKTEEKRKSD